MRVESDRDTTLPALRPGASSATSAAAFASALASARDPLDPSLPAAAAPPVDGERPLAERFGEYGRGASALGYGPPPDPAAFADVPVGPDEPASPLNPSGVTTTPGFVVPGYTARGTPIPPGFYNLAYYNLYLQQGGTPLEGFPELADGATLTDTYGKFGDGAVRATSFVSAPTSDGTPATPQTGGDMPSGCDTSAPGTLRSATPASAAGAVATPPPPSVAAATPPRTSAAAVAMPPSESAVAAVRGNRAAASASPPVAERESAPVPVALGPAARALADGIRVDVGALLQDLLARG